MPLMQKLVTRFTLILSAEQVKDYNLLYIKDMESNLYKRECLLINELNALFSDITRMNSTIHERYVRYTCSD